MQTHPTLYIPVDENIALRTLAESDAPTIFALTDANRAHLRAWLPWVDGTKNVEDSLAYIRTMNIIRTSNGSFGCVLLYRGQIAGSISFHQVDWMNRYVEIGYWLAEAFQGRGLMTKACRAMVTYAFEEWHLNKVAIMCATQNAASCAIPRRLGFTHEGVLRQSEWLYDHFVDLNVYGILANEWQQDRSTNV